MYESFRNNILDMFGWIDNQSGGGCISMDFLKFRASAEVRVSVGTNRKTRHDFCGADDDGHRQPALHRSQVGCLSKPASVIVI